MPMILHRPSPSAIAAAGAAATAQTSSDPTHPAGNAADGAAESWEQYVARVPVYLVSHSCSSSSLCQSHDPSSICTVCQNTWASHNPSTHTCPVPGTSRGSFHTQTDVFVKCQFCNQSICEACFLPVSVQITLPLFLRLTKAITINHAGMTCREYFTKVAAARERARCSTALDSHMQSIQMSPEDVRSMLAASGAKECPACGLPGTHARGHHCHHIKCDACHTKYLIPV
jgi:hypothetical protein